MNNDGQQVLGPRMSYDQQTLCMLAEMLAQTKGSVKEAGPQLLEEREAVLRISERYYKEALKERDLDENQATWLHALPTEEYDFVRSLYSFHLKAKARRDIAKASMKQPLENPELFAQKLKKERRSFNPKRALASVAAVAAFAFGSPYRNTPTETADIGPIPVVVVSSVDVSRQKANLEEFISQGDCKVYPVAEQEKLITGFPGKRDIGRDHGTSYDVRARVGKKVEAMCDGVITARGINKQGYNYVVIDTERGLEIEMLHVRSTLAVGTRVEAGDYIASVRWGEKDHQSGRPIAPHLHTKLTITDSNNTVRYPKALAGYEIPLPCVMQESIRKELVQTSSQFTASDPEYGVPSGLKYDSTGRRVRTVTQVRHAARELIPSIIEEQCSNYRAAVLQALVTPQYSNRLAMHLSE